MLAPFFVNLLMWCVLLLFVGWALDVIQRLDRFRASRRLASQPASRAGPRSRFKPTMCPFACGL